MLIFGIEADELVKALRICSNEGCSTACPYTGKCEKLEKDASKLLMHLYAALNEKPDNYLVHSLNLCYTCTSCSEYCPYWSMFGPEGCDIVQKHAANAIERLISQYFKTRLVPITNKGTFIPKSIEQSADHTTVVVIWNDGTKTIVRLSPNDPDDIYMAFTAALAKKIFGNNTQIKKVISSHLNEHKPKKKES